VPYNYDVFVNEAGVYSIVPFPNATKRLNSTDRIPPDALVGGYDGDGANLYFCEALYYTGSNFTLIPGKTRPEFRGAMYRLEGLKQQCRRLTMFSFQVGGIRHQSCKPRLRPVKILAATLSMPVAPTFKMAAYSPGKRRPLGITAISDTDGTHPEKSWIQVYHTRC
jgi:hypothetical protein